MNVTWTPDPDFRDSFEFRPSPHCVVRLARNYRGEWGWAAFENHVSVAGGSNDRKQHSREDAETWISKNF
jgi:hypothetical protein